MSNIFRSNIYALAILVSALILTALGFLPGSALLYAFIGLVVYAAFIPSEAALQFMLMSLPFYFAVPVTASYVDLQSWRLLILEIVIIVLFRLGPEIKNRLKISAVDIGMAAFLFIALLSSLLAGSFLQGVRFSIWLLNLYLFFIAFRLIASDRQKIGRLLTGAGLGAGLIVFFGLVQLVFFKLSETLFFWQYWANNIIPVLYSRELAEVVVYSNSWFSYAGETISSLRLFSLMPGSHYLAVFLVLSLSVLLWLKERCYRCKSWLSTTVIILTAAFIVLTGVRGIWLTVVAPAALLLIALLSGFIDKKMFTRLSWPIAVFLIIFLAFPFFQNRAQSSLDPAETSNTVRLAIWQESLTEFGQRPILGWGTGNFAAIFDQGDISRIFWDTGIVPVPAGQMSAHNLYLHILVENGILGLMALIFLLTAVLYFAWKRISDKKSRFAVTAFLLVLVWIYAYNIFDVVFLYNDKIQIMFWSILGLINGLGGQKGE